MTESGTELTEIAEEFIEQANECRERAEAASKERMEVVHHTEADTWEAAAHRLQQEAYGPGERS